MVDAFVDREPRPRERGTTRLAKVSPRRNRGSACGGGYGRKGPSRRLAAICGRSDNQIDGDLVIPPFQRCPRSRLVRGSSRNGGLPLSTVAKVGIKTIASWQPADFGDR